MTTTRPFAGGCACGAIRYLVPGEPIARNHCQCRDCQRRSGPSRRALDCRFNVTGHDAVSAAGWDAVDPALPVFDRMPPG